MRISSVALATTLLATCPLAAQVRAPSDGGSTTSIGQPETWKWSVGAGTGWLFQEHNGQVVAEGRVGVYRDLLNPVLALAGVQVEAYVGARDTHLDRGVRAELVSPFTRLGFGVDLNGLAREANFLLSVHHPIRRGGLFGDGSVVRVNYLPGRHHSIAFGIDVPVLRRIPMGKTRPPRDHVVLSAVGPPPSPLPADRPELEAALGEAWEAASLIRRFTVPLLDYDALDEPNPRSPAAGAIHQLKRALDERAMAGIAPGLRAVSEVRRFHAAVDRAFSAAVGGPAVATVGASSQADVEPAFSTPAGRAAAAKARAILLAEVLLPYDRLLGQTKDDDTIYEFGVRARGIFLRWLFTESGIPPEHRDAALAVFTSLLEIVEANRAAAREEWRDSRFVWLPLQYALLPEDHDSQAELDALLEQAVGDEFTEGNFVSYVVNEQFQYQLSRTIRQAEDYHVLWTHDYRGIDSYGKPDEMAYRQTLRSYLRAMTERVRAYDDSGRFPVYLIFIDEWFYRVNEGRKFLELLEDPLHFRIELPREYSAWEDTIAMAQRALRDAVRDSRLLQAQARQYGDAWLRNLIKVHVNVTNPGDASFWSWDVIPLIGLSDNMMRDHRKIVFYDISEKDPYRGEALFTGAGVGEHYANLSWEDRSLLVRGPALLGLRDAARNVLLNQGVAEEKIPWHLQARSKAPDYDARIRTAVEARQHPIRALEIHNETGFNLKQVNLVKAMLYTLMPAGSVLKIPDSLWNSPFWGSLLLGCALRGGRVLIIAPAAANAPTSGFGQIARSRDLMTRMLRAKHVVAGEIDAAGGLLKIGIFAPVGEVTDIPAKVRAVQTTFAEHAWLRDLYGFPASVYDGLGELADALEGLTMALPQSEFESDARPKLHLKANFFASAEAWSGLMARPEWAAMTWEYVQQRIGQVQSRSEAVANFEEFPEAFIDVGGGMVQGWLERLDAQARGRVVFFTLMGSHNQNYRSMVIDGEVAFVASGWPSIIPYLDIISIVAQSRWVEDPAELDELLPQPGWVTRRFARWAKLVL